MPLVTSLQTQTASGVTVGAALDDPDSEAFVASFIAGLFLTHRRMASISQEGEAVANIMIEDLWPELTSFADVLEAVEALMAEDAVELTAKPRVRASHGSHRRACEVGGGARSPPAGKTGSEGCQKSENQPSAVESAMEADAAESFEEHEWLVE